MKKLLALLLALMMVLSLAACAKDEAPADEPADAPADAPADEPADAPADAPADDAADAPAPELAAWEEAIAGDFVLAGDEAFDVAFINQSYTDKFTMRVMAACKAYFDESYPNCNWLEGDGEFDPNIQIGLAENYLAQGVDVIILNPCDSQACGSVCGICKEANTPLVTPNSQIDCGDATCTHYFVGSDHFYAGQLQAEFLMETLPSGDEPVKLCYLEGTNGFVHTTLRIAGFFDTLDAAGYNYELLSSLEGEYMRDKGLQIAEDWFTKYGDEIDAIAPSNDEMIWGALEAMKGAGISGVVLMGIDANDDTKQAVVDGEISMTVFQNAEGQGKWGAIQAYNACLGMEDNVIDVPYERVDPTNVADYM